MSNISQIKGHNLQSKAEQNSQKSNANARSKKSDEQWHAATQKFNEYILSHSLKMVYKPVSESEGHRFANELLINEYAAQIAKSNNGVQLIKKLGPK